MGPLAPFLAHAPRLEIDDAWAGMAPEGQAVVFAGYRLQDIADYRLALRTWFEAVRPGGVLVIVVPHAFLYERQNALPSRWNPEQRRLYTPASLMDEIEESLSPNSYRVRHLGDADSGYDYGAPDTAFPVGRHDVQLVLERIAPPSWSLSERTKAAEPAPPLAFEPLRTRVERDAGLPSSRILILKLDHLGDFIMGIPALEKARAAFPHAEITLVIGSWNREMAQGLSVADRIMTFDGFPRNSGEEVDDIRGKVSAFEATVTGEYDLAIDLRTDPDTRLLLQTVRARIKAGLGTRAEFDFLDIFLPVDRTRHSEGAWRAQIPARDFSAQPYCDRTRFQISCEAQVADPGEAIVWGPYRHLPIGRYIFAPFVDFDWRTPGIIAYDIAMDVERVVHGTLSGEDLPDLHFSNEKEGARFEFRLWGLRGERIPSFQLFGGALAKAAANSVLHQSEYLALLVELVSMRINSAGQLQEWRPTR